MVFFNKSEIGDYFLHFAEIFDDKLEKFGDNFLNFRDISIIFCQPLFRALTDLERIQNRWTSPCQINRVVLSYVFCCCCFCGSSLHIIQFTTDPELIYKTNVSYSGNPSVRLSQFIIELNLILFISSADNFCR